MLALEVKDFVVLGRGAVGTVVLRGTVRVYSVVETGMGVLE